MMKSSSSDDNSRPRCCKASVKFMYSTKPWSPKSTMLKSSLNNTLQEFKILFINSSNLSLFELKGIRS